MSQTLSQPHFENDLICHCLQTYLRYLMSWLTLIALYLSTFTLLSPTLQAADISDTASRTSQPDKFLSAPGLIKGGLFMQGSKKRFEGANELNIESYQTRLEIAPSEVSLIRIREPQPNDQITLKFTLKNESDK